MGGTRASRSKPRRKAVDQRNSRRGKRDAQVGEAKPKYAEGDTSLRNSKGRRRKRNFNWRSSKRHTQEREEDVMESIEEQLRKQREEQRKRKESSTGSTDQQKGTSRKVAPAPRLGNFVYDKERDTYYPKHSMPAKLPRTEGSRKQRTSSRNGSQHDNPIANSWRSLALPSLTYLAETCPSRDRRTRMRDAYAGRVLFNSIQVLSVPHPQRNASDFKQDLFCKSLLHPSCRTFDVIPTTSTQPLIATLGTHEILFSRNLVFRAANDNHTAIRHLPLLSGRPGTVYMGCLSHSDYPHPSRGTNFTLMDLDSSSQISMVLEQRLARNAAPNDLCVCKDSVMMAPTRSKWNSPANVSVIHISQAGIDHQMSVHLESDLPESDAFCIQAAPMEANLYGSCAIGYRNGQIALWDGPRARRSCVSTTEQKLQTTSRFGAASALAWLSNGNHILARGSFGDCHLYDVRKMSNASLRSHRTADPSLLLKLSAPPSCDAVRSNMALYCNGVAMDPTEVVAIAPLLTESEDPCFGFWSLRTGEWFGQNCLDSNASTKGKPPPYLELCGVTTPACTSTENGHITRNPSHANRFGLWFKCGRSLVPTDGVSSQALKFCNIYHMSCQGATIARSCEGGRL